MDYWLFAVHGLGGGLQQVLRDPADLLVVLGLSVVSAVFHECGHAAGCRYGGARPGVIGVGIYLVWPSFFTNVTDSYRLSRAGRLRTDLGGLYFNLIFMLALAGIYAATSAQILLLVIAVTHLEMLEQLLPFVRFDGYFILSDLVGVPDLFARVAPILKSALPAGRRDPRVTGLRRRARIVVTGWVLCVIPLLTASLGYLLLHLPQINRALWRSASPQAHLMAAALAGHRYAMAAIDAIGVALVALSLAGSLYIVAGLARRRRRGLRWSAGRPARRLLAAVAGAAWRCSPPSGPGRASSAAGSPPARHPVPPARARISPPRRRLSNVRCTCHDARCTCRDGAGPRARARRAAPGPGNSLLLRAPSEVHRRPYDTLACMTAFAAAQRHRADELNSPFRAVPRLSRPGCRIPAVGWRVPAGPGPR